jgi:uncharacterized surface protein with fasciclin (FAS1) repeats
LSLPAKDSTTLVKSGLTSLAGALRKADLVSTLDGLKDVTIFAPTNYAFRKLGAAAAKLTKEQLAGVLEYHVVAGTVAYSSLLSNTTIATLTGANLQVTVEKTGVYINSARVIIPDVLVDNGVVHVIDR